MKKKKTFFQEKITFSILILSSIVIMTIMSCGGNNKEKMTAEKEDTTAQLHTVSPPTITLPIFSVEYQKVKDYFGTGLKNPKKFIIRFEFHDLNDPFSELDNLLLYPAKDHKDYAQQQSPLEVPGTPSMSASFSNNIVIGNNELDAKLKLLDGSGNLKTFDSLKLIPFMMQLPADNKPHLLFHIKLVKITTDNVKSEEDLGNTNPSPPAQPGYN